MQFVLKVLPEFCPNLKVFYNFPGGYSVLLKLSCIPGRALLSFRLMKQLPEYIWHFFRLYAHVQIAFFWKNLFLQGFPDLRIVLLLLQEFFLFLPGILVLCQTVHLLCCFFHEARCQSKWCLRLERAAQKFVDSGVFLLCFRYRFLHLLRLNVPLILLRLQLQELIQMIFSILLLQIPLAARNYFC